MSEQEDIHIPEPISFSAIQQREKRAFLRAYAESGSVRLGTMAAKVDRSTHYKWLADDEQYAAAFEEAKEYAADKLEDEARRRAEQGTKKLVIYKGAPVMVPSDPSDLNSPLVPLYEHQYSDVLAIFLLKGMRPDKYRERVESQNTNTNKHSFEGPDGGPPDWLTARADPHPKADGE